jgi:hypothetical protein
MRQLEDSSSGIPRASRQQLLLLLGLIGLVLITVIAASGAGGWPAYLSAGGIGALMLGSAVRSRTRRPAGSATQQVEAGWTAVYTELARSRRHDRRFTIVGIPEAAWAPANADQLERADAGVTAATMLQTILRRSDRAWADGSMLYTLITDCDTQQSAGFMQRARATMPQLFRDTGLRVAVFPDDGITLGALLARLGADTEEPQRIIEGSSVTG